MPDALHPADVVAVSLGVAITIVAVTVATTIAAVVENNNVYLVTRLHAMSVCCFIYPLICSNQYA